MKNPTYIEKLRSPFWQKKRLEIFERDNWTCQSCGRDDLTLNIHHLKYLPGLEPWDYEPWYLVTYCEKCHETEHLIGDQIRESLAEVVDLNKIFIRPISLLTVLSEMDETFFPKLRHFLNDCHIEYLKCKSLNNAA